MMTIMMTREVPVHERIEAACAETMKTPEYQKTREEVNRLWDELRNRVDFEIFSLLLQYDRLMHKFSDIDARACYLQGLSDATRII